MKLIDLLVRELPKRGGWPNGATRARQSSFDTEIYITNEGEFVDHKNTRVDFGISCTDCKMWANDVVTKEQYQSALAASQKVEWSGDGLPQVGCECECHVDEGVIHCVVVGYDFDGKAVVMRNVTARKYFSIQANSGRIKPLRSEEDKKRYAAIESLFAVLDAGVSTSQDAIDVYDAIAAGKIPGVKLED